MAESETQSRDGSDQPEVLQQQGPQPPLKRALTGLATAQGQAVQATYDRLLAQGQVNEAAALQVGQTVEQTDIADLTAAQEGLTAADVRQVYEHLLVASQHHLAAFQR